MKAKHSQVISHGDAVIMVRETFNVMDPERIEAIIGAIIGAVPFQGKRRGDWPKDSYWSFTREEFAARLASLQALFRRVMIAGD